MKVIENKHAKIAIWSKQIVLGAALMLTPVVASQLQSEFGITISQSGMALAQQEGAKKKPEETRRTPALRNKVYERLSEAQAAAEEKDFILAIELLDKMRDAGGKRELNSYELANLYNLYAFVYYSQERYGDALRSYENVVKQENIPLAMEINTRFTIAQLYFVQERWPEGIKALKQWFELSDNPSANAYVLLGQGYYQIKDYDQALFNVKTAVDMYKANGKVPKEQWYSLLRFLYYEKNDVDAVVGVLEEMLVHYPKKQYWVGLSHMYGEKKLEPKQLAAMETAYVQGMLDRDKEQLNMAYLFLGSDVPYKAAKVLDKGIKNKTVEQTSKNLEVLGNSWRQAQEIKKSIPVMEQAAAKAEKGELYARLGNIYLDNDNYEEAITAIVKGLKKGGVKRKDNANLVLGMAYFNTKQYSKARKAFKEAQKDKRSKKFADQWLKYMANELERQKKLAEG
jgi:tetratricopeptide (TPR) repeat protein